MVTTIGMKDSLPVSLPGYGVEDSVHWTSSTNFVFMAQRETVWELRLADISLNNRVLSAIPALGQASPAILDVFPWFNRFTFSK